MNERRGRDVPGIAGCAIAIVAGALAIYYAKDFTALGSVFPRTVATVMIVIALAYIAIAVVRPSGAAPAPGGSNARRIGLAIVMVAWSALLERVGFLATSIVAYAAIMLIANYDRWTPRRAAGYTLAGAIVLAAFYGVFRVLLQVPLPQGFLL